MKYSGTIASVFVFVLIVCFFATMNGCGGGGKSATEPDDDDNPATGIISELTGDENQLVLEVKAGNSPLYTQLKMFGVNSCLPVTVIDGILVTDLGDGWWSVTFNIPVWVDVSDQWRFGFVNPDNNEWLNGGYCEIMAVGIQLYEGSFAFSAYIGNEGNCYAVTVAVSGSPTQVVLDLDNGQELDPQFTEMLLWAPDGSVAAYSFQAATLISTGTGKWRITFNIPADANVAVRWTFGIKDPANGSWLPVENSTVSGSVKIFNGNFVFSEYCGC